MAYLHDIILAIVSRILLSLKRKEMNKEEWAERHMAKNPLNDKNKYYAGSETSHSEWLRRFIIKHNCHTAKRVPDWELPRLRLIVHLLNEIEKSMDENLRNLLNSVKKIDFPSKKTTSEEVEAEIERMEMSESPLLTEFRKSLNLNFE